MSQVGTPRILEEQRIRSLPQPDDPVVMPGHTGASMTDLICGIALRKRAPTWWLLALIPAATLFALLIAAIAWTFYAGVGVWGIGWPVVWGFAIINYVWWIAIASGGTFISALFFLTRSDWRNSLNRSAETMTVFAAACAGLFPILHLGRPWLFYWLFPYPDTMGLWPQFRSPLLWDFFAIFTYVTASVLFWYFGMIPDLASVRDQARTRGRRIFYGALALGFRGSGRQWRHYEAAYAVLAAIMAPLVVSVHSIVGLDFAGAATVGWHSTQFPPFFVFGALLSGFALVLLMMVWLRAGFGLEDFITGRHFDVLGRMLLASSLAIAYAYAMEAFMVFYASDRAELTQFLDKVGGHWAPVYWATIALNVMLPQVMWFQRFRLNRAVITLVSLGIIFGMWCERYVIIVMSLRRTHLPSAWGEFYPTFWDWALLFGSVGLFLTGVLLVVRYLPVISMFEMRRLILASSPRGGRQ
jgi:Ni/Fe-hydrogenase subunit HybB-like protein